MININTILVGLDLSPMDDHLIKHASFLAKKLDIKKVYFTHNVKKYAISELFQEQLKDLDLEQIIGDELSEKITNSFDAEVEWDTLIAEDPYTESIFNHIVNKYYIDMILVGNKIDYEGAGVLTDKLLRMVKCPLLIIPETSTPKLDTIWAGTDFSRSCMKIYNSIDYIQEKINATIVAAHVYQIPAQFSPYVSADTMKTKLKKHSQERLEKFINRLHKPYAIKEEVLDSKESTIAEKLIECSQNNNADLLMVADKGSNNISSLMLGSVTDELSTANAKIPIWVVK
ncbi:universal stress protein [Zunongwangia profunda]|uniref:Universal stress protein family protein n=3 Tax=Zunongwangia profunda TaxID=398743 RepID=D5BK00_ZUNPS|nr:universal stress protein [Zunongwangia profunda]ADF53848.1 universal stress protein family protein [Zunongwangia profunda SM-A87]MAS72011.1 universal stress protein [Zunongwangia sp.]HCV79521.1 universal stress protein [Zunongwangia profunda]|tara:strand:+ start:13813 stop:14670 length:858 start_codon:yes stop_codon:yes gene_type:complete